MGELISTEHLFELRRLRADVDRAERTGTTPPFHREFQHMLWGNSVLQNKIYQEAQRKRTELLEKLVDSMDFPPKPKEA